MSLIAWFLDERDELESWSSSCSLRIVNRKIDPGSCQHCYEATERVGARAKAKTCRKAEGGKGRAGYQGRAQHMHTCPGLSLSRTGPRRPDQVRAPTCSQGRGPDELSVPSALAQAQDVSDTSA